MTTLALVGGTPVFSSRHTWPQWPMASRVDERRILDVVRSGEWGIGSPYTQRFAEAFADSQQVQHVLPVANGTAALELVIRALDIGEGDEVIVPSYTFVATATAVLQAGASVIFADIDLRTFNMDPAHVAKLITRRTKAIVLVHFAGNPCDMAGLQALGGKRGIPVIEDAAHAHGMFYRGKPAGSLGLAGCFSFQSSKNMASGEGGAITTNDSKLFELAQSFHSFGRKLGRKWYEHYYLACNERLSGMQSALLLGQLERLEAQTCQRHANAMFLDRSLAALAGQHPQEPGDTHPRTRRAHHIYMWRYDACATGIPRGLFLDALKAEGVAVLPGYPMPLQDNVMFRNRRFWHWQYLGGKPRRAGEPDYRHMETPVAKKFCAESVLLTQNMLLGPRQDMQGIVDAVAKVLAQRDVLLAHARGRKV